MSRHAFDHSLYRVSPSKTFDLSSRPTRCDVEGYSKADARDALEEDREALAESQRVLYADGSRALLIIFQAPDAAGKDSTIRHVMSGVNPQGCQVTGFKAPTDLEVSHHFLWRPTAHLPPKGMIGIFNRSYYEETLVVRVHPEWLTRQKLPPETLDPACLSTAGLAHGGPPASFWQHRFEAINAFEKELVDSGTTILKFFLNVSKDEQRERLLDRIHRPEKNWKFNANDIRERRHWDTYRSVYQECLAATSTSHAPWYIIPADQKWFMRSLVADIVTRTIDSLNLQYPKLSDTQLSELRIAEKELISGQQPSESV